jgi:hypothetical protein
MKSGLLKEFSSAKELFASALRRRLLSRGGGAWDVVGTDTEGNTMGLPVYYQQGCPVCGRLLRIRVTLLGRRVYCQHCGGGFLAVDPSMTRATGDDTSRCLDGVVDDLLERAALVLERAAAGDEQDDSRGAECNR